MEYDDNFQLGVVLLSKSESALCQGLFNILPEHSAISQGEDVHFHDHTSVCFYHHYI